MTTFPIREVRLPIPADLEYARSAVSAQLTPAPMVPLSLPGGDVLVKLETLQPTGSFKVRGALTAASSLPPGHRIITCSAGNHALGIAWAAGRLGVPATVVLAETASPAKLAALRRYPIEVVIRGKSYDEAEAHALELARTSSEGVPYISAYNDPLVIAGQSTVLDEIVAGASGRPLTVVVPTGGGGLLAGIAMRAAELSTPGAPIRVVGVESAASMAVSAAVAAGGTVPVEVGETIADGLSGNLEPGSVTVEVIRRYDPPMVRVSDPQVRIAIRYLVQHAGIVVEGAGASAMAAVLASLVPGNDDTVVAIASGRNIALSLLATILAGE